MAPKRDPFGRFIAGSGGARKKVMGDLNRFSGKAVVALTLEVQSNLVRAASEGGTPVDTGWARSNWVPTIGPSAPQVYGEPKKINESVAGQGVAQVATQYRIENGPVHISNFVPYIQRLNAGSSDKAPPAFVQKAIAEAVISVEKVFGKVFRL